MEWFDANGHVTEWTICSHKFAADVATIVKWNHVCLRRIHVVHKNESNRVRLVCTKSNEWAVVHKTLVCQTNSSLWKHYWPPIKTSLRWQIWRCSTLHKFNYNQKTPLNTKLTKCVFHYSSATDCPDTRYTSTSIFLLFFYAHGQSLTVYRLYCNRCQCL